MPTGRKPAPGAEVVVAAAIDILDRDGIAGLTIRALAQEAGTTTMTVYSRFGGKQGVITAIRRDGLARLSSALDEATDAVADTPRDRLQTIGRGLRLFARQHPHHYRLMLGDPIDAGPRDDYGVQPAGAVLERIQRAAGPTADPEFGASLLAFCHGWIGLEKSLGLGDGEDADRTYGRALDMAIERFGVAVASNSDYPPAAMAPPVEGADLAIRTATPRNAPCPCGSGLRYKHCHGLTQASP